MIWASKKIKRAESLMPVSRPLPGPLPREREWSGVVTGFVIFTQAKGATKHHPGYVLPPLP